MNVYVSMPFQLQRKLGLSGGKHGERSSRMKIIKQGGGVAGFRGEDRGEEMKR